ncbi:trypsin beta-like [Anopheles albimanus]|uniref:Uncharacterized protein n=1 Tax=Anopheles albimanus TaxID=7167 RepID=A0A182FUP8_ANOAL|nr:trypsin beta-like [Anopheles albimanus]
MKQVISVLVIVIGLSGTSFAASLGSPSATVSGRIIGGTNATINNYPFMMMLYGQLPTNVYALCGASVISPYHALTAAHCFYGKNISKVYLRVGSSYQNAGGTLYTAKNYTVHPGYNPSNSDNDAAVVLVTKSFLSVPGTQSIPLQNNEPAASTTCYALGWGNTSPNGPVAEILQLGNYTIQTQSVCNQLLGTGRVTAQMYCATATKGRVCLGDSGGPLVCGGRVHGIVSFGKSQCPANTAEVFAKVPSASIRNFIRQVSGI